MKSRNIEPSSDDDYSGVTGGYPTDTTISGAGEDSDSQESESFTDDEDEVEGQGAFMNTTEANTSEYQNLETPPHLSSHVTGGPQNQIYYLQIWQLMHQQCGLICLI